jgi:hypothetical protein
MKFRMALAGAMLAACAVGPSPASAATCGYQASPVFAPWGDSALYALPAGADFESGSSGWSWINKAKVASGDSNPLLGNAGTHAVTIPASGGAKSPWLCVDASTASMRFFLRRTSGAGNLTVTATLSGSKVQTIVATITGSGAWAPSPSVVFPDWGLTGSLKAQFVFTADASSTYTIDDVYIDPWRCC